MSPSAIEPANEPATLQTSAPPKNEQPYGSKRPLRVIILGCGVSAINFFKRAEENLTGVKITCYEKNTDVGGTWLENRYAGCACDIPSVNYQFSWKPHVWTKYYSGSEEIWNYVKAIEREHKYIDKYVRLQHEVVKASWEDKAGEWTITVKDLTTGKELDDKCDVFVNAGGVLNNWKWPDIEGLHDFGGKLMHSATWDGNYDLRGKKVAIIGAGSSGVQIVANIYERVGELYTWIRSPVWITAGFAQAFAGEQGKNFEYTDEQKKHMAEHPNDYLAYRKIIERELNQRFSFIIRGTPQAQEARAYSENEMRTKLGNKPDLANAIIPTNFGVGCRRPTPGNGYLEAISGEKTTCFSKRITKITSKGFVQEGTEHEVDAIVCATGFDTTWVPRFSLIVNGEVLNDAWKSTGPPSYLSLASPSVPNYFTFCGPYGPLAHGSFFPIIEAYTAYIHAVIYKLQTEKIVSVKPKMDVVKKFQEHSNKFLERTSWSDPCSSWFKGGTVDGVPKIFPGSRITFLRLLERVRWEDYDIIYEDEENPWAFLGNGFSVNEHDGSDITWYLGGLKEDVDEKHLLDTFSGQGKSIAVGKSEALPYE